MSDRVNQLIEEIREKTNLMKQSVETEKSKNSELSNEVDQLKNQLQEKEGEIDRLKGTISNLETKMNDENNKSIEVPTEKSISDEQIDELVKEIEFCITQLKK